MRYQISPNLTGLQFEYELCTQRLNPRFYLSYCFTKPCIMTKRITKYTLLKKDVPKMKGKTILSDARVGGEKLVYSTISYPISTITLFNRYTVHIPLVLYRKDYGGIGIDLVKEVKVFYRPYKKHWVKKVEGQKIRVPFHLWGKKEHPLTNIWVQLAFDYKDIYSNWPVIEKEIENHILIKFLRQHEEQFNIIN